MAFSWKLVLLGLLVAGGLAINQKCDYPSTEAAECPQHSSCIPSGYCACDPGWALDCQMAAEVLSNTSRSFEVSTAESYYTIVPSRSNLVFVYKFRFCTSNTKFKDRYKLTLFADEGTQKSLTKDNQIGSIQFLSRDQCWEFFSPYMEFGLQPNGNMEQMILQLTISPQDKALEFPQTIKFQVEQIFVANLRTLWIIILIFLCTISLTFLGGVIYCIYFLRVRRNRRGWNLSDNNIDYFDEFFPKKTIKKNEPGALEDCPICLSDFKPGEKTRTVICNHTFHADCLDKWCKRKISCPVCRSDLSKETVLILQAEKKSLLSSGVSTSLNEPQGEQEDEDQEDFAPKDPRARQNMKRRLI